MPYTLIAGISSGDLPRPRREEGKEALRAWWRLKKDDTNKQTHLGDIVQIIDFLGFSPHPGQSMAVQASGSNWLHVQAHMHASLNLVRPIPQLGSKADGHYDVLCVWERQSMDDMTALMHELRLDARTVIVLYLGRASLNTWHHISRTAKDMELTMVMLDEVLLLYLTIASPGSRLPVFLRCALPYTYINPYTPFQAGDVPPEMFFGREEMARELQRPEGSCLVYGGRQLGKSALLRHVQREFHQPRQRQFAIVEDIKLVGDPLAGDPSTNAIFYRLRDAFRKLGLLPERTTTDKVDEICNRIRTVMEEDPSLRIIMLFDEADSFLEADSKENFASVSKLKDLMNHSGRRFKVVFAGLQNVQRYQGMPNQPLAHFGAPLRVGPLEPDAAERLVREPLAAIGYRLDSSAVLHVLSYTNYHPGLLQVFCHELVKERRKARQELPCYILRDSVEAIYRKREVRDRIRERFEWTLALDKRYQALAWTLVVQQMDNHDSYSEAYQLPDIQGMVLHNWQKGFEDLSLQELKAKLDEMCGLGVLVRDTDGKYRLRSPNLVPLMGTTDDIKARLEEIREHPAPITFDAENYHTLLKDGAYSPLTYAQESLLRKQQFGVGLVFASKAMGSDSFPAAFHHFVNLVDNVSVIQAIPGLIETGPELKKWLTRFLERNLQAERMVVYQRVETTNPRFLHDIVEQAVLFCQKHQAHRRWLRILLIFDARATWQWLSLRSEERQRLENQADAVVWPAPWSRQGIHQRLEQQEWMVIEQLSDTIMEATGGWPYLVDSVFRQAGKPHERKDILPIARQFTEELYSGVFAEQEQFIHGLGLEPASVLRVLEAIKLLGEMEAAELDVVGAELISSELDLSLDTVKRCVEYLRRLNCLITQEGQIRIDPVVDRLLLAQ